ncbi:MAG TPA: HTTM domain-containing protein, partial [Polyangiaceae bacterium]|nr:HTTM domain-containing protein [Polyangiaceae bacterium]
LGDAYVLGLVRVVLGLLLFANALRAAHELKERGYFGEFFHWPMIPEPLVPSRSVYDVVVMAQILLSALVVAGYRARFALLTSGLLGAYVLFCDRVQYHNNRWALFCYSILLSLGPCDRSFYAVAPAAGTRVGPLWAARLAQAQASLIYVASGGSKLLDPDWRSGRVILERFHLYGYQALAQGVPPWVMDWFSQPGVTSALSKVAIATELALAVGLWSRRGRVVALWWGVWFHLTIEATSRVEGFTWLTFAIYALFVTPSVRERKIFFDSTRPRGRVIARAVALLDWFARFEIKPWAPDDIRKGHSIVVVRRDGSLATGPRALAMVARCTPPLFPLWAPLAFVASFTEKGEPGPRS